MCAYRLTEAVEHQVTYKVDVCAYRLTEAVDVHAYRLTEAVDEEQGLPDQSPLPSSSRSPNSETDTPHALTGSCTETSPWPLLSSAVKHSTVSAKEDSASSKSRCSLYPSHSAPHPILERPLVPPTVPVFLPAQLPISERLDRVQ